MTVAWWEWPPAGVTGLARPREWDAVAVLDSVEADGDELSGLVLPDGTPIGDGSGETLRRLAAALDLEPPFRFRAVRRSGTTWAVGAVRIEVARLPGVEGEELQLLVDADGARSLEIDGRREIAALPVVERVAGGRAGPYVLRATRLTDSFWETAVDPL